jgi:hypothetical protein
MFELLTKVFESLGPWPIVQFAAAALIFYVGLRAIQRGEKDKKPNGGNTNGGQPSWTMYGPVHDAIGAIHEMNEQSRKQVDLLERIEAGVQASKSAIEMIRNESRLR